MYNREFSCRPQFFMQKTGAKRLTEFRKISFSRGYALKIGEC